MTKKMKITDITSVLNLIKNPPSLTTLDRSRVTFKPLRDVVNGYMVNVSARCLRVFKYKGIRCAGCGIIAKFFKIERNQQHDYYTLNLYGIKRGRLVLFTTDHIIPRIRGGSNCFENLQTMCELCNVEKSDSIWPYYHPPYWPKDYVVTRQKYHDYEYCFTY